MGACPQACCNRCNRGCASYQWNWPYLRCEMQQKGMIKRMKKRIGIIGTNSVEYVKLLLHIWNEQNCAVLVDPRLTKTAMVGQLNAAKVDVCYVESGIYEGDSFPCYIKRYSIATRDIQKMPMEIVDENSITESEEDALIIFSSGSTAQQKGVRLSYRSIL